MKIEIKLDKDLISWLEIYSFRHEVTIDKIISQIVTAQVCLIERGSRKDLATVLNIYERYADENKT